MFKELSIIIPAYNEEKIITTSIKKTLEYCKKNIPKFEIIIVDDGSKDNTIKNIPKNKNIKILENKKNTGKGYSVKKGILYSKYDYALFMDADLSTPLSQISKFSKLYQSADILIGSRETKDSDVQVYQPFLRRTGGKILKKISQIILPLKLQDTQCGFKLFNKKAKKLFLKQTIKEFAFDMEILWLAKKYKLRVKEVGVIWRDNRDSRVDPIKDSIRFIIDAIKIRFKI